jgi:hypothetical protein
MALRWSSIFGVLPAVVLLSAASADPILRQSETSRGLDRSSTSPPTASKSVRTILANFLEGEKPFRKYDDDGAPKLVRARIAGPVLGLRESNPKQPLYCVQVDLIMTNHPLATLWATHDPLEAVITFLPGENGGARIQGQVLSVTNFSRTCHNAPFAPFPELEQVRAQRRRALKRADP